MCVKTFSGSENCMQWADEGDCHCAPRGGVCQTLALSEEARSSQIQLAVQRLRSGRSLLADGPYYVVRSGAETLLKRKCDGRRIRRLATNQTTSDLLVALRD